MTTANFAMTATSPFLQKVQDAIAQQNSLLSVGLDPNEHRLPVGFDTNPRAAIYTFCREIIDACAPFVCAFKPQIAYFSSLRAEAELEKICRYLKDDYPHLVLILDAKRGDISSTANEYAREAFERYGADAVTLNPYMGRDSIEPFIQYRDKGVFLLCRTSNPCGDDFQNLELANGKRLYQQVAQTVVQWNHDKSDQQAGYQQYGLVVGASYPQELAHIRAIAPDLPILSPGVGAQGADIQATVLAGCDAKGGGLIINSSRAILYADRSTHYLDAAATVAKATRDAINSYRPRSTADNQRQSSP